jgi:hypothetical protein
MPKKVFEIGQRAIKATPTLIHRMFDTLSELMKFETLTQNQQKLSVMPFKLSPPQLSLKRQRCPFPELDVSNH